MKRSLTLILLFFISLSGFGNAAMPGLWSTGHGGRFIPLFKEDSLHFGKVRMQRELVMINLYPGFAAVKGEYWMVNDTDEPVDMRVGYPVNGRYDQQEVNNVMFQDLYKLTVLVNDQQVNVTQPSQGYDSVYRVIDKMQMENWYYWRCTFAPKSTTKITVYFLTNNNESTLRQGYARENGNAFAYILETGRAWGGVIEKGEVLIKLNEGLELDDMRGVYPTNTLFGDDKHLQFAFTNLEPDSGDNILLWYDRVKEGFDFKQVENDATKYFAALDAFPVKEFDASGFKKINKDDFEPHDSGVTVFWVLLVAVVVFGLAVLGVVIYFIYRLVKRSRRLRS
jgi:hypothetical protein